MTKPDAPSPEQLEMIRCIADETRRVVRDEELDGDFRAASAAFLDVVEQMLIPAKAHSASTCARARRMTSLLAQASSHATEAEPQAASRWGQVMAFIVIVQGFDWLRCPGCPNCPDADSSAPTVAELRELVTDPGEFT